MVKKEFLKRLRSGLHWTFTEEETADILTDYEGFFASGASEGKDEPQICAELGSPADIARGLAETLEKKRISPLWLKIFTRMLFTAALCLVIILMTVKTKQLFPQATIMYVASLIIMWIALIGFTLKLPPVAHSSSKPWNIALILCHVCVAAVVLTDFFYFYRTVLILALEDPTNVSIWDSLMFYVWYLFDPITFIPPVAAVISVFGFYRASHQWLTVVSHALGAIVYLSTQHSILRNLDDPAFLPKAFPVLTAYVIAVIVSILLGAAIYATKRRRS